MIMESALKSRELSTTELRHMNCGEGQNKAVLCTTLSDHKRGERSIDRAIYVEALYWVAISTCYSDHVVTFPTTDLY